MSKMQRNKGKRGELEIVKHLHRAGYVEAMRNLTESRGDADNGIDIYCGRYALQVKRWRKYAPISAYDELPALDGKIGIMATRGDALRWMAVLHPAHLLQLGHEAQIAWPVYTLGWGSHHPPISRFESMKAKHGDMRVMCARISTQPHRDRAVLPFGDLLSLMRAADSKTGRRFDE